MYLLYVVRFKGESTDRGRSSCQLDFINYIAETPTMKYSGRMFFCHNGTYSELRIILQQVDSLLDLSIPSGFMP